MIRYDMLYLTATGLPPVGSSTVHIYTQTVQRITQSTQTMHRYKCVHKKIFMRLVSAHSGYTRFSFAICSAKEAFIECRVTAKKKLPQFPCLFIELTVY